MKRFFARLGINFLAFECWGLAFFVLLMLNPDSFTTYRNLQRAVEPADKVFIGVRQHANGRRQLDCLIHPGAHRATLASKLELGNTLLLLEPGDLIREQQVAPQPPPDPAETRFFMALSWLVVLPLLAANPVGRLRGCWRTRQRRSSQVKLALACALLLSPILSQLPGALSNLWLRARVSYVLGQPQQTFRVWRNGHQGIVVLVSAPSAHLQAELARALQLGPQDRLTVQGGLAAPVAKAPGSPWLFFAMVFSWIYGGLLWLRLPPAQKQKSRQKYALLIGRVKTLMAAQWSSFISPLERICRHKLFLWH